ncbi:MFS transporter [Acrocarpospora macrocephala]|uniref:MFS transporter n=1 Tax=Acrocarpospora macrocephala TaxID=150177 RepID=A0A5M3WNZ0_9ACTN|nr:MFS transporter [Acrocarpospora macrocephala]GES09792.1 MFS transporter [Acrocarpospora macrocephala]
MPESWHRRGTTVLLAHAVMTQVITFVLRPTMSYRAIELDVPAAWLGVLGASFAVAPLLLAIPAGQAADRYGERRMAVSGAVLLTASGVAFLWFGHGIAGLVLACVLLGAGHLGCVIAQQAMVANTTERGGYDAAFGRYTFAASIGQAAGPVLISAFGGGQAIPDTGGIFLLACFLAAALVALSVLLPGGSRTSSQALDGEAGLRSLLRMPGITRALVTSCVVLAAVDITLVYLPALGAERGLASGTVGLLLAVRGVASMASRFFLGRLSRAVGRRRLLIASTTAAALAMVLVPLSWPLWILAALLLVLGFGLGVGQPLTMSWLAESAPPGLRGRAMSLRLVGNRTGQLLIPGAAGLVATGLGAAGVLWVTALGLGWAGVSARRLPIDP